MKTVVLSDYVQERLQQNDAAREGRYMEAVKSYEADVQAKQDVLDGMRLKRDVAGAERQHLKVIKYFLGVLWASYGVHAARRGKPFKESPGLEDHILEVGHEGEDALHKTLGSVFDHSWTLLCGYHNPGGEIDSILVGPGGIFAMEIKNKKGIVHCDGDRWWRDKEDAYGNLVRRDEPIEDKGHRGPSRQVNDPADRLERFLISRSMPECKIYRAVIFTDPSVRFGDMENITVDGIYALGEWDLEGMVRRSKFKVDPENVALLVNLIQRDHRYYEQRRASRSVPDPSSPKSGLVPAL
ncbi:MAG: nuclease-related domain-containing protein [Syntrophorhabdales bacterium]